MKIEVSRAKRGENFWKTLHIAPNSSKFRSDYLFSFQNRRDYLFPVFLKAFMGFIFAWGKFFMKKAKLRKTRKLHLRKNFTQAKIPRLQYL